ncbi:transcriptional regulator [Streptomyces ruber]|uniref:Transcriptional regulator n=2 Tax=Streptomyces TaxID=1883 RepID=A0A918EP22_9ACTN|nr:helix-turn-helix transcriptional regulator [Streptomyces ruber]GGQ44842.1 transcriptional regulator [Streptomyces ruber]
MSTRTFDPQALRRIRLERGLSQIKLSKAVGLYSTAIGLMENGRNGPSVTTLVAIADALGARMDDFMTRADREEVSA